MNLNLLAARIAHLEGKKINLSIAQIKEVIACYHEVVYRQHWQDNIFGAKHLLKMLQNGKARLHRRGRNASRRLTSGGGYRRRK